MTCWRTAGAAGSRRFSWPPSSASPKGTIAKAQQADEDINADGQWTAADCQGAAARPFAKSDVYVVVARADTEPYDITASCADVNDVLLAGGCTAGDDSGAEYAPQVSFGPVNADSVDQPAGYSCWYSAATGSSHWLDATATCMRVE